MAVAEDAALLLERDGVLAGFDALLDAAEAGSPGVVVVEGGAGLGKTALMDVARRRADERQIAVLAARGHELEGDFAFGVVRQLVEPYLTALPGARRAKLFGGAAELAKAVLLRRGGTVVDPLGAIHGLYWLLAGIAGDGPLVIVVDDAHWSDSGSLHWLAYAAARLEGLPVAVLIATRPPDAGGGDSIAELEATPGTEVVKLAPLGEAAVARLAQRALGREPEREFALACAAATAGNPFALRELLRDLEAHGIEPTREAADALGSHAPERFARAALVRLAHLGRGAVATAQAFAVLGDGAELQLVASLARLELAEAVLAADALVGADFLADERPLRFVHPLLRAAIYEDIPRGRRSLAHTRAAQLLRQRDGEAEEVAAHLLLTEAASDPRALQSLRAAAATAMARAAPASAITYLRRALAEAADSDARAAVMYELGGAEVLARDPGAAPDLRRALELTSDPLLRGRIAYDLAQVLLPIGEFDAALAAVERSLDEIGDCDHELTTRLEQIRLYVGIIDPRFVPHFARRATRVRALAERSGAAGRGLSLLVANVAAAHADGLADVVGLVEHGLEGGELLEAEGAAGWLLPVGIGALVYVDALPRAQTFAEAMLDDAQRRGSVVAFASGIAHRCWIHARRGELVAAETDLRTVLEIATQHRMLMGLLAALHFGVDALLERPQLDDLAAMVETIELPPAFSVTIAGAWLSEVRGRLRLVRHHSGEGIDDLRRCGEAVTGLRFRNPMTHTWRTPLALALSASDRDEALRLVAQELALARATGLARPQGVALRTAGLLESGERGIELLRESLRLLEHAPSMLERARTLVDLGAALRRDQQRHAAREPLRAGLDLAERCGAERLARRAEEELKATGARPRRRSVTGRDSLTPSEKRVAHMAAEGMSTPEIAQTLFITIKTVEMHLGRVYRKLDISSRGDLPVALATSGQT